MNEQDVLVTVAVVSFNSAKTVIETLNSIKDQTYKNIELIITDDGSTDSTTNTCKKWLDINGKLFANYKLITVASNTGIPANCNRALYACKGKWIKLIAADDTLKRDCIKLNIDYISTNSSIEILQTNADMYIDTFEELNYKSTLPANYKEFFLLKDGKSQYNFLKNVGYALCAPAIFIKKEIIEGVGGFDERFKLMEDLPLWLNLTKSDKVFHYYPVSTVNYRSHGKSVIRDGKVYMDAKFAKNALYFLITYFSKKERSLKIYRDILQLKCFIGLDNLGLNNQSKLSYLLYSIVHKI